MIRVYGSRISYYAGKLEAYLRFRGIEYELLSMLDHAREIRAGAGAVQSPVVQLEDGRWMSDTTPIIAWFEAGREGPSIYPDDPALRFLALLLEDHADEWLWRPAMHYRWSYLQDRQHASGVLADELLTAVKAPRFLKRWRVARRQLGGFVHRDGVSAATRAHVERTAMAAFDGLEAILAERPFLLGDRPTIADFGFVGPMLRHFAMEVQGCRYERLPVSRYRVWCLEELRRNWGELDDVARAGVRAHLPGPHATVLWEAEPPARSEYDPERRAPFHRAINVFGEGVPR